MADSYRPAAHRAAGAHSQPLMKVLVNQVLLS